MPFRSPYMSTPCRRDSGFMRFTRGSAAREILGAVTDLTAFIAGLPKAELHVHHVGSASMDTVATLAERHAGSTSVPTDPAALAEFFTFTDFGHFIEVYLATVDLLRTPGRPLDADPRRRARPGRAERPVRRADLHALHVDGGRISAEAYVEALEDARRRAEADFGLTMRWIFDIPGESGIPAADVTLDVATRLQPDGTDRIRTGRTRGREFLVRSSSRTSTPHEPRACTASRTPVSPPVRRRSSTPSTCWGPSASATGSPPRRTRR